MRSGSFPCSRSVSSKPPARCRGVSSRCWRCLALIVRPRLLLLDEPSLGLAPRVVQEIFRVLAEINREGTTILLVEQNARLALRLAQRAYVLELGRIQAHGPSADLAASDAIAQAYLGASVSGSVESGAKEAGSRD